MVTTATNLQIAERYGKLRSRPKVFTPRWIIRLLFHALIGVTIMFINFPNYIRLVVQKNIENDDIREIFLAPLNFIQEMLLLVVGAEPITFFERAMTCSFIMVLIWLALSILVSIRHKQPRWVFLAGLGLSLGFFTIHLLSWAATGFATAFGASLIAFGWVKKTLGSIVTFAFDHQIILSVVVFSLVVFLMRNSLLVFLRWCVSTIKNHWPRITGTIVIIGIAYFVVPLLWRWIILPIWNTVLSHVLGWALWLISIILGVVFALLFLLALMALIPFAFAVIGSLLLAQLHAGWHAGRNTRYVLVAGFVIGSLLTLIMLTGNSNPDLLSSLNRAWTNIFFQWETQLQSFVVPIEAFNFFLPEKVENFSKSYLTGLQAPTFDTIVLLLVLTMAIVSMIERLLSSQEYVSSSVPVMFILTEYLKLIVGMLMVLILIFVAAIAGGD